MVVFVALRDHGLAAEARHIEGDGSTSMRQERLEVGLNKPKEEGTQ